MNIRLIKYELRNIWGNPFAIGFGIIFPVVFLFLIAKGATESVPESMISVVNTEIFLSLSTIIPLAIVFIGYAANYSQELEKEIPLRMKLFGFSQKDMIISKIIAYSLVVVLGLGIYTVAACVGLELETPKWNAVVCLVICLLLLLLAFFGIAHGVAGIFKKFGPTYAVTMSCYFGSMIMCGMMGVRTDQLPTFLQKLAKLLPMYYITDSDFGDFWMNGTYHFANLVQSFLFLGAVSGIVLLISIKKNAGFRPSQGRMQ